jgi:hypothetical protein
VGTKYDKLIVRDGAANRSAGCVIMNGSVSHIQLLLRLIVQLKQAAHMDALLCEVQALMIGWWPIIVCNVTTSYNHLLNRTPKAVA